MADGAGFPRWLTNEAFRSDFLPASSVTLPLVARHLPQKGKAHKESHSQQEGTAFPPRGRRLYKAHPFHARKGLDILISFHARKTFPLPPPGEGRKRMPRVEYLNGVACGRNDLISLATPDGSRRHPLPGRGLFGGYLFFEFFSFWDFLFYGIFFFMEF